MVKGLRSAKLAKTKGGKLAFWRHPGGKLRRVGPTECTDKELLAIIIGTGNKAVSAEETAQAIIDNYHSLTGLMGKSIKELMKIKGMKIVKATQIAAAFEIARRIIKSFEKA